MADITMCQNEDCPVKDTCFRYLATPSQYQSFYVFDKDTKEPCDWYWECTDDKELEQFNRMWRD
jgi:hypothetical protein